MASLRETERSPVLEEILSALKSIQVEHSQLASAVDAINGRVNMLAGVQQVRNAAIEADSASKARPTPSAASGSESKKDMPNIENRAGTPTTPVPFGSNNQEIEKSQPSSPLVRKPSTTSRIILTTYPGQSGIDPVVMNWGHKDYALRGPVVVSRSRTTVRRRNAIGAHGGSYSIYRALAVASSEIDTDHRPDFTNTEPAADIGPFPMWADPKKIVSMDPLGHLAPWLFKDVIGKEDIDVRPTIAVTKAHMKLPELEQSVKAGRLVPDGKICLNETGELAVTKFAVEPVWYLPGVAERFGIGKDGNP
ncbi:MAG: hypothetical protein M1837_000299 [Sclerophora amabilis]|nr:MAG: hypothetical protein M1837_000299 [Sclerophora amabilis]